VRKDVETGSTAVRMAILVVWDKMQDEKRVLCRSKFQLEKIQYGCSAIIGLIIEVFACINQTKISEIQMKLVKVNFECYSRMSD